MPKDTNKKQNTKKQDGKKKENKRHFIKDFKIELKRVTWPTLKQLLNNTIAVITVVLITAAIVLVLDFIFESMNTYGINKLKEIVDTTNTIDTNTSVTLDNSESVENTTAIGEDNDQTENSNTDGDASENEVVEDSNSEE